MSDSIRAVSLINAMESILRPLIRASIGRISLSTIVEMVETMFIQEAERSLSLEAPNKPVKLAQMGLLTGLDTRIIHRIQARALFENLGTESRKLATNFTPTTRLLDKWSTDLRYRSTKTGQPECIQIFGECPSIEHLMKEAQVARGTTPTAVADRLVISGAAKWDESKQQLCLCTERFFPKPESDFAGAAEVGVNAVVRLLITVLENLKYFGTSRKQKLQRCYWTNRLPISERTEFEKELVQLMTKFENEAIVLLTKSEDHDELEGQLTAGFGIYYFEDQAVSIDLDIKKSRQDSRDPNTR